MSSKILWPLEFNSIRRHSLRNTFDQHARKDVLNGKVVFRPHWGWDFYAPKGTICYAIAEGHVVIYGSACDTAKNSLGLVAVLCFTFGTRDLFAAYCHLSGTLVGHGSRVKAGQAIGLTGCSGNAHGMQGLDQHLHFEIRTSAKPAPGHHGRISPLTVFGKCPLDQPIIEPKKVHTSRDSKAFTS